MGAIDRVARLTLAMVFVAFILTEVIDGALGTVLVSLAIVFTLTSTFKYCPIYALIGINSCDSKKTV